MSNLTREQATARINQLTERAKRYLVEAGKLADEHDLHVTFETPDGTVQRYSNKWVSSSCYGENSTWYDLNWDDSSCVGHWDYSSC